MPESDAIYFYDHRLINQNIKGILRLSDQILLENTTIMLMSPSCSMCHEKLSSMINKKIHKKKYILFFADSRDQTSFNEMKKYFNSISIKQLDNEQIESLNKGIFPLFLDVTSDGFVTRVYMK